MVELEGSLVIRDECCCELRKEYGLSSGKPAISYQEPKMQLHRRSLIDYMTRYQCFLEVVYFY